MKISHTPLAPSERIGSVRSSQPLVSLTSDTPRASGAHTANAVPRTPWWSMTRAPSRSHSR